MRITETAAGRARTADKAKGLGALVWIFTFTAAFLLISWRVMPLYGTAARLEREEELVFVLKSYKRAILKYKRVYGAGPSSLADLVKSQPNPRFIRALYDDPFHTGEIKVRNSGAGLTLVRAGANEIVNVKSSSFEKSAGGVEYSRWYVDGALKRRVEE